MGEGFNQWLGFISGDEPGSVHLTTRAEHEVVPGVIHFAVLATLCEVAAARAVAAAVMPADLHLSLLRPASPGQLVGRGRVIKRGRTLSVVEGTVHQGDRLVAQATVTFAMVGPG